MGVVGCGWQVEYPGVESQRVRIHVYECRAYVDMCVTVERVCVCVCVCVRARARVRVWVVLELATRQLQQV